VIRSGPANRICLRDPVRSGPVSKNPIRSAPIHDTDYHIHITCVIYRALAQDMSRVSSALYIVHVIHNNHISGVGEQLNNVIIC